MMLLKVMRKKMEKINNNMLLFMKGLEKENNLNS